MSSTQLNREKYIFSNLKHYYSNPLELKTAQGSYVTAVSGKSYLDFIGGIVTISIGHNHPRIKKKLISLFESNQIQHTSTLYASEFIGDAAKKLVQMSGLSGYEVYFSNSGSEANEIAILTAREATKRQLVISLRHGYHGGTNTTINLCGHSNWKFPNQPYSQVSHIEAPYCYRCPFGKAPESCHVPCADDLDRLIQTCTTGEVAAVIVEPVMGVGGFIDGPKKYFKRIFEIIKDNGGLYISDEVQTGVGRLGKNFLGISDFGIAPDIVTMAKGLGNGVPVGATIARAELVKGLHGKTHFSTFGGDPYQMAQVYEVLCEIDEKSLIQNAKDVGRDLKSFLKGLKVDFPVIGDVRGRGLLVGIELVNKDESPDPLSCNAMMNLCLKEGLLIGKGGLHGNVIRIAPPLNITKKELKEFKQKFENALKKLSK
jgi:4-aminobutyrate aminotransferase-like enzyme